LSARCTVITPPVSFSAVTPPVSFLSVTPPISPPQMGRAGWHALVCALLAMQQLGLYHPSCYPSGIPPRWGAPVGTRLSVLYSRCSSSASIILAVTPPVFPPQMGRAGWRALVCALHRDYPPCIILSCDPSGIILICYPSGIPPPDGARRLARARLRVARDAAAWPLPHAVGAPALRLRSRYISMYLYLYARRMG